MVSENFLKTLNMYYCLCSLTQFAPSLFFMYFERKKSTGGAEAMKEQS